MACNSFATDPNWCFQTHRQSPVLSFFKSASEVRALSSTGITRSQRSYDPLRLPSLATTLSMMLKVRPPPRSDLPQLLRFPCSHAVLNTPADRPGALRFLPSPCCLPRLTGGSASAIVLSRPAQASLALRPANSQLAQKAMLLSRGFDPASCPTQSLGSYHAYRKLHGWILPPLEICAVGAHS